MKYTLIGILLCTCNQPLAGECVKNTDTSSGTITIIQDTDRSSGMYHVRAPKEYLGEDIKLLALTATMNNSEGYEITVPLQIKSNDSVTGSYFHMSTEWLSVKVMAAYGDDLCLELHSTAHL